MSTPAPTPSAQPKLPSVLPSCPALKDTTSTVEEIGRCPGRVTGPAETPIFICAYEECYRLFPNRDRLMVHRRRDHDTDYTGDVITWNE